MLFLNLELDSEEVVGVITEDDKDGDSNHESRLWEVADDASVLVPERSRPDLFPPVAAQSMSCFKRKATRDS